MPVNAEPDSLVLVMDRDDGDAKLISSTLEKAGFHVMTSSNETDAVNLCRTTDPQLAIIDTNTPGIHTPELLGHMREVNPTIRVLLMADSEQEVSTENRSLANVRGQLSRPFRRAQLLGSVLEITRQPLVRTA